MTKSTPVLFSLLVLISHCQAHAQVASDSSKPRLEVAVKKLDDADSSLFVKLSDQIEGRPIEITFQLHNRTGKRFAGLKAVGSCSCVSTKFLGGENLEPDATMDVTVTIKPGRDIVKEAARIICTDENGTERFVTMFSVEGRSFPPLRPAEYYYQISSGKPECTITLLAAAEVVKATDLSKTQLTSKFLEVKDSKVEGGVYEIKVGLKEGQTLPDKDFAAVIRTPFSINEKTMLMEEVLTFVSNPRYEVSPHLVQLAMDRPKLGKALSTLNGSIVVKDFVRKGQIFAVLVTARNGDVCIVDPDIISEARWIGKTNVCRIRLKATVYDNISDEDFYVVLHGPAQPNFRSTMAEFVERNDVFKVWITEHSLESP